jgi:predicted ATPase
LHRRIGERLEAGFGSQSAAIAPELALHFERGGDLERAVEYLVAAAAGIRQRSGGREAVAYLEHALALLDTLPESVDRDRRELELRMHLSREWDSSAAVSATERDANRDRVLQLRDRIRDSARVPTPRAFESAP